MTPSCKEPIILHNGFWFCFVSIIWLTDCSGNGEPIIAPRCKAECNCSGGWEGEYCERISANGGGDPHLETLDGKYIYISLP